MTKYQCDHCGYYVYRFAQQRPYVMCPLCLHRMRKISPIEVKKEYTFEDYELETVKGVDDGYRLDADRTQTLVVQSPTGLEIHATETVCNRGGEGKIEQPTHPSKDKNIEDKGRSGRMAEGVEQ